MEVLLTAPTGRAAKMMTESYQNTRSMNTMDLSIYNEVIHQVENYVASTDLIVNTNTNMFVSYSHNRLSIMKTIVYYYYLK